MAIYKPVSSIARRAIGIGGSILGSIGNTVGSTLNNKIGGRLGSIAQSGINLATTEITKQASHKLIGLAYQADKKIAQITRKGLKTFGLNSFDYQNIKHNALHHAGNLSIQQMWEIYKHTNVDDLSHKNFYVLEINDKSGYAPSSNGAYHSKFNLFTTNLSFNSFEISGEAVAIGASELDKPTENARTTMTMSILDDKYSTIKQWAEQKSQMISASDGTFMPPAYYVFEVRVVFGTNIPSSYFYEQVYTMRVQSMSHELSRSEQALEEIQLTLVQSDTCMPNWLS